MTKALYLPNADRSARWFADDYPNQFVFDHIEKLLWHSTETPKTGSCPGYSGGSMAPQVTINPWPGYKKTWQHWPLNRAGRALGNPSITPVSENKDYVLQVEVIGYSDPTYGRQYGCYLPELPQEGIDYLAAFAAFVTEEWGIADTLPSTWPLYKVSSWAAMDAAHMSSSAYDAHRGWLAHLHAPKPSTHGDAALPIAKIRDKKRALLTTEEDDMFTDTDRARLKVLLDDADGQTLRNDVAALSAKVDALAKNTNTILLDQAQLEAAIRNVLGSLDNPTA